MLGLEIIELIINVLGIGVYEDFDLDKLCYYKIIFMVDVDVDGVYICILLLILLFWFMCLVIDVGYVYLV